MASQNTAAFSPPERRRFHEHVSEQLRDAILDGRFPPGSKLPPERELAAEFKVNRTSIREALKVLESLGLIMVRQGDGATVQPVIGASLDLLAPMIFRGGNVDLRVGAAFSEVMHPLLFELTRLAIERFQPEQLATLARLRDRLADHAAAPEERMGAVRDLIVTLSDLTGNPVWQMIARRVHALLASPLLMQAREQVRERYPTLVVPWIDPDLILRLIDQLLQALARGDREAATAALRRGFESMTSPSPAPINPPGRAVIAGASRRKEAK